MERKKHFENSKLEFECVEESARPNDRGVLLGVVNPESANKSSKQQAVISATENKYSGNENSGQNHVEIANESQKNVEEKSQIQTRQSKKNNIASKALSLCQTDEKHTENTNVEKKIVHRRIIRKSVIEQYNELLPSNPTTCLPSTSSTLSNGCSRKTDVDKTNKGPGESSHNNTSLKPNNCGPSNKNTLKSLFPHVGLPYFPDYMNATPVPISNERKLPKPRGQVRSLAIEKVLRDTKMTPPPDSEFLRLLDCPKSPELKKKKKENVLGESQYPQPLKGKQH